MIAFAALIAISNNTNNTTEHVCLLQFKGMEMGTDTDKQHQNQHY